MSYLKTNSAFASGSDEQTDGLLEEGQSTLNQLDGVGVVWPVRGEKTPGTPIPYKIVQGKDGKERMVSKFNLHTHDAEDKDIVLPVTVSSSGTISAETISGLTAGSTVRVVGKITTSFCTDNEVWWLDITGVIADVLEVLSLKEP